MRIHLFACIWNEAPILPWFFRHYDPLVERYVFYDNGSTDETLSMLAAHPRAEIRHFDMEDGSIAKTGTRIKSQCWKESRGEADLVIVCDLDEFLHHPQLPQFLSSRVGAGVTIFRACGYEMQHPHFPQASDHVQQLREIVTQGSPSQPLDKPLMFDPVAIEEINYSVGCHDAAPVGRVQWLQDTSLRLLHFKQLGPDYFRRRQAALWQRQGPADLANGWNHHYKPHADALDQCCEDSDRLGWAPDMPSA